MTLIVVCAFTFIIHLTESSVYSMRIAGVRTRQIAIALSFVTSSLLVSRLSYMGQGPLLGNIVDVAILNHTVPQLEGVFRIVILMAFLGSLCGLFMTPTVVVLFEKAILKFSHNGSFIWTFASGFHPRNMVKIVRCIRIPGLHYVPSIVWTPLPKGFLLMNIVVTGVYTIGVLSSLLAGAYLPHLRSTAIQLSSIVNGVATILMATIVDPAGARITDQVYQGKRPTSHIESVVFFLLIGRLIGTLIVAQIIFKPSVAYIMIVTQWISNYFGG